MSLLLKRVTHYLMGPQVEMRSLRLMVASGVLLVSFSVAPPAMAGTVFVDLAGSPIGSGISWAEAVSTLARAVAVAKPGDEIWVAGGVYRGTQITLEGDIALYGGFAGIDSEAYPGGEKRRDERDIPANETILDADFIGDDDGFLNRTDNWDYIVLLLETESGVPRVDGFTITGGYAFKPMGFENGGAVRIMRGSAVVENCKIVRNSVADVVGLCGAPGVGCADGRPGGGVYVGPDTSPTIRNCEIRDNRTGVGKNGENLGVRKAGNGGAGAGIYCGERSRPIIDHCIIEGNVTGRGATPGGRGGNGAGIACINAFPIIRDCVIASNITGMGGSVDIDADPVWDAGDSGDGAGIYCLSSLAEISNCIIKDNRTADGFATVDLVSGAGGGNGGSGAGVYCRMSRTTLVGCVIANNVCGNGGEALFSAVGAGGRGGGVYLQTESAMIRDCSFINNRAGDAGVRGYPNAGGDGGGLYAGPSLVVLNCCFVNNVAGAGGGLPVGREGQGGGIMQVDSWDVKITNCTLYGNEAHGDGGGVYALRPTDLRIANCILWENRSRSLPVAREAAQIDSNDPESIDVISCCIHGLSSWFPGDGNIGIDPRFVGPNGADGELGTEDDDLKLSDTSPCINAGQNKFLPDFIATDLAGVPRVIGSIVDMGAYETSVVSGTLRGLVPSPNPFRQETTIRYVVSADVAKGGRVPVSVIVYDFQGRIVKHLASAALPVGAYGVRWDGRTDHHGQAVSGVYYVRVRVAGEAQMCEVIFLR